MRRASLRVWRHPASRAGVSPTRDDSGNAPLRAPDTGAGRMAQDTSRGGIVTSRLAFAAVSMLLALPAGAAPPVVLVNHPGYDPHGPKRAVVQGHPGDAGRSCAVEPLEGGAPVPTP